VFHNLLSDVWSHLNQADLRLLLEERIGGPGQFDGETDALYLPLAREKCRIILTYKGSNIVAIKPGHAFDQLQWDGIRTEIENSLLIGPRKIGRELTFSTFRVDGWWRGARSNVQIMPPPSDAPPNERNGRAPLYS
jgi:hypothetical protein